MKMNFIDGQWVIEFKGIVVKDKKIENAQKLMLKKLGAKS